MMRPRRLTCGTTATGDIFRFLGRIFMMSSHRNTLQKPALIWYSISSLNNATDSGVRAVGWGPRVTAALMTSQSQSGPQSTGIPRSHSRKVGENG